MTGFESFRPYCEDLTLMCREGGITVAGFIQPEDAASPERAFRPLLGGVEDGRRYILIAGVPSLEGVREIRRGGDVYEVLRWENISGSHTEALLKKKAGEGHA